LLRGARFDDTAKRVARPSETILEQTACRIVVIAWRTSGCGGIEGDGFFSVVRQSLKLLNATGGRLKLIIAMPQELNTPFEILHGFVQRLSAVFEFLNNRCQLVHRNFQSWKFFGRRFRFLLSSGHQDAYDGWGLR